MYVCVLELNEKVESCGLLAQVKLHFVEKIGLLSCEGDQDDQSVKS